MSHFYKTYEPYVSPFDPCPPITTKVYSTPPQLYMGFQPPGMEQFTPREALRTGTLWKAFYDPYYSPYEKMKGD
ncbi:spore coat associated protein CotJA [Rossellomorea marisflavi]|uniref:spore coat associated protein CotJA n=1 Tax=Rossellomorea marisflavi TaxID=189381 RepID=UPI002079A51F|nr:spore coat associated protein CotJA [Rossellomorea marisflavi]USK90634.1 spore coat associated protein CotJA [Rossellomorea marisflavi]